MPKASKESAEQVMDIGVGHVYVSTLGDHEVSFLELREPVDLAPLLRGLPGDLCTCPHWGYVVAGEVTFTFADRHTEVFRAGDAFHVGPDHSPALTAGTEWLIISPSDQIAPVNETLMRNTAAAAAGRPA